MSEPLILSGSDDAAASVPRVPLFAVPVQKPNPAYIPKNEDVPEGYDTATPEFITELKQYDMPTEVNPVIGLEYGERSGVNAMAANVWIIQAVVGEDAYRALVAELKRMTPAASKAALEMVTNKIVTIALGN